MSAAALLDDTQGVGMSMRRSRRTVKRGAATMATTPSTIAVTTVAGATARSMPISGIVSAYSSEPSEDTEPGKNGEHGPDRTDQQVLDDVHADDPA